MGDKAEGGVKNLKKWVTSFMDGPKEKIEREMTNFEIQNIFLKFSSFWPHDMPIEPKWFWRPNVKQSISIQNLSTKTMAATADAMISSDSFRMETMTIVVSKVTSWNQLPLILR